MCVCVRARARVRVCVCARASVCDITGYRRRWRVGSRAGSASSCRSSAQTCRHKRARTHTDESTLLGTASAPHSHRNRCPPAWYAHARARAHTHTHTHTPEPGDLGYLSAGASADAGVQHEQGALRQGTHRRAHKHTHTEINQQPAPRLPYKTRKNT